MPGDLEGSTNLKMNLLSYIRVSGNSQVDGDGFDRQREKINAFCKAHNAYVGYPFFDKAVSGTVESMDRPAFARMLNEISNGQHGKIDGIVVERMDRLARDLMISELLLRECRERGLKVFSADQGQLIDMADNSGDPTRVLIRQLLGALAQWEKSVLVMKMKAARDRIKATGKQCEGNKPYGYYPGEETIKKLIVNLRNSNISFRSIADMLNTEKFKTRTGNPWGAGSVHNIYEGATNAGTGETGTETGAGTEPGPLGWTEHVGEEDP